MMTAGGKKRLPPPLRELIGKSKLTPAFKPLAPVPLDIPDTDTGDDEDEYEMEEVVETEKNEL